MKVFSFFNYIFLILYCISCSSPINKLENVRSKNLIYLDIPNGAWPAYPLGNGLLGEQVWKKDSTLRFTLDCAKLWDLRPMKNIDKFDFKMVQEHVAKNDYGIIQQLGDQPYLDEAAPCRINGATLSFDISSFGKTLNYTLDLPTATCVVDWENGISLKTFVHATQPVGWFSFSNVPENFKPSIILPQYSGAASVEGGVGNASQAVASLHYSKGEVVETDNSIVYNQPGWGGFSYQVAVKWHRKGNGIEGVWSISTQFPKDNLLYEAESSTAIQNSSLALQEGLKKSYKKHCIWWSDFWQMSSISLPEGKIYEDKWYLEQFKYGSSARKGAPAIGLLGVWVNDNGMLPDWKGDYHNDINTQFPYWTAYSGNHLQGEWSLIDWLWKLRPNFRQYTKDYFGVEGLNAPGVCTLDGKPMGGWIQYANGPTVSSWFAQHFYWHWRYSMDRDFLKNRAYPWFKEVITYLDNITEKDENGMRKLPLSSSPEFNGNGINAWYKKTSNFDLALIRFTYCKGAELAGELGYTEEQQKWLKIEKEWPDYDLDENGGLTIAPGQKVDKRTLLHSQLHGIFPLGIINMSGNVKTDNMIKASLSSIEKFDPQEWPLHMAIYYARAWDAEKTLKALDKEFNSGAHYYKDIDGSNKLTIRKTSHFYPIVIQEMLLQSHAGYINIFPAVPSKWKNCSFKDLRTEGAFLVSAERKDGKTSKVTICSEKGGKLRVKNPFGSSYKNDRAKANEDNTAWEFDCKPGDVIVL